MSTPTKRDLDGVYFRAERDGQWTNRCWTDLTDEERERFGEGRGTEWWRSLADHLAERLRAMGGELDVVGVHV